LEIATNSDAALILRSRLLDIWHQTKNDGAWMWTAKLPWNLPLWCECLDESCYHLDACC